MVPKITNPSLVSQRFDRIKPRRLARGVISEKYSDSDREHRGHHDRLNRHLDGPTQGLSYQIGANDPKKHSGGAPDQAQHDRFSQELKLDGCFGCSHSHSHSDLTGTFGNGNQHHVHNPNSSNDQRNRCDCDQENGESLARVELRLNDVLRIPDIKVILLLRTQVMSIPEYSSCLSVLLSYRRQRPSSDARGATTCLLHGLSAHTRPQHPEREPPAALVT